jgi:rare lipoprotein A (peptidoglycan hydrolase)
LLRRFPISRRRRLRDVLIAGTIAAAAVGVAPHLAWAHSHFASRQHHLASKQTPAEGGEGRDRRSLRAKLFNSPGAASASSPRSPSQGVATNEVGETLGIASIYSGSQTASGEIMDAGKMTAAHRTLPFGTQVTVVNRANGRSVMVRIRGRLRCEPWRRALD